LACKKSLGIVPAYADKNNDIKIKCSLAAFGSLLLLKGDCTMGTLGRTQRDACLPTENGCARCQSTGQAAVSDNVYLLLGPQNAHAHESLARELDAANVPYRVLAGVLALRTQRARLSGFALGFLQNLPAAVAEAVKAVFYSGDLDCAHSTLAAFVRAEPISVLLADARHEWVRDALDDDWLTSFFHPIVEANTGLVFGYEALIRARHPQTQELIGAGPIIASAHQLKLEHVLDQQARRTAIKNAAALDVPNIRFFINFLPNTIYDPEICLRTTMEAADQYHLDPARLVFEVVETEHIPDMARLRRILDYYRSRGVGTAVDDMGAGFASLQYLSELRPDFVKIDRDLMTRAEHEDAARRDLDMVVHKAKELGIFVIAEGIETPAQMQLSLDAGVDYMQGFLFARPANPPEAFRTGLRLLPKTAVKAGTS